MRERGGIVVGALVVVLTLFPLGFFLHSSPRFPGSLAGSLIGIAAAVLMLVPLTYVAVKRIPFINRRAKPHVETRTLLSLHIYAGVVAPILGLIHAAHKFNSPLGVSLTGIMLVLVISGFFGRYLLTQLARALRGRQSELAALKLSFLNIQPPPVAEGASADSRGLLARALFQKDEVLAAAGSERDAESLAGAVADVEYAVRAEGAVQSLFGQWRKVHVTLAVILYTLLALHIWAGLYYGLRWL